MRLAVITVLTVLTLSLLMAPATVTEVNQTSNRFELTIMINEGNARRNATALYLQEQLALLGIDVKINILPFASAIDQFFAMNNSWDIWIIGFGGGSQPYNNIYDLYACDGFFGYYQGICDANYQANLENSSNAQGNPLTQSYLDSMYNTSNIGFDVNASRGIYDQIQQVYMNQVLNSIPLMTTGLYTITDPSVTNYDFGEHPLKAVLKGASPNLAMGADTVFKLISSGTMFWLDVGNFNPIEMYREREYAYVETLMPTLFLIDKGGLPHPNVALNFSVSDWTDVNGTTWSQSHWKFTLRNDVYWVDANRTRTSVVKPSEYLIGLDALISEIGTPFLDLYSYEANDTAGTLDIYLKSYNPNTISYDLGRVFALPSSIFTGNYTISGIPVDLKTNPITGTDQWKTYQANLLTAGAYLPQSTEITLDYERNTLVRNPYFWYPSEFDSGDFDLNTPGIEDGYFFTSGLQYDTIEITSFADPTLEDNLFDVGGYDAMDIGVYDIEQVSSLIANHSMPWGYRTKSTSGDLLMLNMQNPYLANYDVRRAIAHAIDKQALNSRAYSEMGIPVDSPLYINSAFYTDKYAVPYDMNIANQLLDVVAPYTTVTTTTPPVSSTTTTTTTTISNTTTTTISNTTTTTTTLPPPGSSSTITTSSSSTSSFTPTSSSETPSTSVSSETNSTLPPPNPLGDEQVWVQAITALGFSTFVVLRRRRKR